ncbi:MAG: GNAT family N-acetyltransferase [Candidatus Gastranaerophilales bacterium]|nr:GNAT family N-acetyltransferase [Candidatus Gastranaerophilales bacterium]
MAEITNYVAELLTSDSYKIFKGVYNDFKSKAVSEYKFELEPLEHEEFIDAVEKNYLKCIVLKENQIPTAFLVYTTSISESIELNLIHCLGAENETTKQKVLIEKFLELTEAERQNKVVSYPMLGHQSVFTADIAKYGFKFIGLAVLRFIMGNASSERILENMKLAEKPDEYKIVSYDDNYREDAIRVIHESFKDTQDAVYDTRYKSIEGTKDIINKVVENIYGEFLPDATSVLLCNDKPCGFAFANITGGKIANIPLVAIEKNHRGKGFSELLLNRTIKTMVDWTKLGKRNFSEVNVTTETNNYKALKMYRKIGFREDYCYPQAYLVQKRKK